jgi:hypothetical protein
MKGPRYGNITAEIKGNDSIADRFRFKVGDEQQKEVTAKCDLEEIPSLVDNALLKAGWFCTDWGDRYTASDADYLVTLAAAYKHFEQAKQNANLAASRAISADADIDQYNPGEIVDPVHDAGKEIWLEEVLMTGVCHSELETALKRRLQNDSETMTISRAIRKEIQRIIDREGASDASKSEEYTTIRENAEPELPSELVYQQLLQGTVVSDVPNTCPQYLPEFSSETEEGATLWDEPLDEPEVFHIQNKDITDRYSTSTRATKRRDGKYLQVGVITADFAFYERFKKVGERKYQATDLDGSLPAIQCAAVLRDQGYEITNLPTPAKGTIEELYRVTAETAMKIFKTRDENCAGAIKRLNIVCETVESQALDNITEQETVPQQHLPGATGDGIHKTYDVDKQDTLLSKLPDTEPLDEAEATRPVVPN